jgi:GntR family carbon starvation induced transcriptional regulator
MVRRTHTAKEAPPSERPTLTKSVYEKLRAELLNGKLSPGKKLRAEALRARFQTGSSPIREALNRLVAEGFVVSEEQKGFHVAPVSFADMRELVAARAWIDGIAIRASIEAKDTAWEEALVLAFFRLSRVGRNIDHTAEVNSQWERLHRDFHIALVNGCGSRWICRISTQLFDAGERYRRLALHQLDEASDLDEHKTMMEACINRDADKAVQLIRVHYDNICRVVTRSLEAQGAEQTTDRSSK